MLPGLDMYSTYTDSPQYLIAAAIGSTVDHLHDLYDIHYLYTLYYLDFMYDVYDLYDLYDLHDLHGLDHDLSEV